MRSGMARKARTASPSFPVVASPVRLYLTRSSSISVQTVEKGEPNCPKLLGVQTFSVAASMTLYSAPPPDRILTRSPHVTACRGRDLASRLKKSLPRCYLTAATPAGSFVLGPIRCKPMPCVLSQDSAAATSLDRLPTVFQNASEWFMCRRCATSCAAR